MPRLSPDIARFLAEKHNSPLGEDFHELGPQAVERVLDAADEWGYRPPRNANGSMGRYFYAYLNHSALGGKR